MKHTDGHTRVPIIHLLYALGAVIKSKCCGGVWGYRPKLLHAFLSLALVGGHWLISPYGHFTPGKEPPTPPPPPSYPLCMRLNMINSLFHSVIYKEKIIFTGRNRTWVVQHVANEFQDLTVAYWSGVYSGSWLEILRLTWGCSAFSADWEPATLNNTILEPGRCPPATMRIIKPVVVVASHVRWGEASPASRRCHTPDRAATRFSSTWNQSLKILTCKREMFMQVFQYCYGNGGGLGGGGGKACIQNYVGESFKIESLKTGNEIQEWHLDGY